MIGLPDWTAFKKEDNEHRGLDPLGLAPVGNGIVARRLLPGITNTTDHIRYYSFFCWVFWSFWKEKKGVRLSDQKKWLARLENLMRAATRWRQPDLRGLVGVTETPVISIFKKNDKVEVDRMDVISAFIPAFYSASFRALGCGKWTADKGAQLTTFGENLAEAFDLSMNRTGTIRSARRAILSDQTSVSVGVIKDVADAIALKTLGPSEPEHHHLVELLLRIETGGDQALWQARSRSCTLLLEILNQGDGEIVDTSEFHEIFATDQLPSGRRFDVAPHLSKDFQLWKRYQERQCLKLSIYALWHEVVQLLEYRVAKRATASELLEHARTAFETSDVALKFLGRGYASLTVATVQKNWRQKLRATPRLFGSTAMALTKTLLDEHRSSSDRVGSAVFLLLLITSYWEESRQQIAEADVHHEGGRDRLSLATIWGDTVTMNSSTTSEYLLWVLENYVLKQTSKVAVEKLPYYRYFIVRDDGGYRLVRPRNPSSYLSYDPPRTASAISLLSELSLIQLGDTYRLTNAGRQVLKRLHKRHSRIGDRWGVSKG